MSHSSTKISRTEKLGGRTSTRRSILDDTVEEKSCRERKEKSLRPEPVESKISRQELVARAIGIRIGGSSAPKPRLWKGGGGMGKEKSLAAAQNAYHSAVFSPPGGVKRKHEADEDVQPNLAKEFLGLQDNDAILNQILLLSQGVEDGSAPSKENELMENRAEEFGDVKIEDFLDFGSTKLER